MNFDSATVDNAEESKPELDPANNVEQENDGTFFTEVKTQEESNDGTNDKLAKTERAEENKETASNDLSGSHG